MKRNYYTPDYNGFITNIDDNYHKLLDKLCSRRDKCKKETVLKDINRALVKILFMNR